MLKLRNPFIVCCDHASVCNGTSVRMTSSFVSGGQTCFHCSSVFEVTLGNGQLSFENFASWMRIHDAWLADNRKFTVDTITAKLKSS